MGVSASSVAAVVQRIGHAREVAFGSFVLYPGKVRGALVAAAKRGAHVEVTLQRDPYHASAAERRATRESIATLRAAGATVTLLDRARAPFHLKAAVCDGVAYLNDKNWTSDGDELIVADDDPHDVAVVRAALRGDGTARGELRTAKGGALAQEAALIDAAGDAPVVVESETFGDGPIAAALLRHARRGAATTVIVAPGEARSKASERAALRALRHAGVVVRATGTNQKCALAGDAAWVGSANATYATGAASRQVDWGMRTREPTLVAAVRAALRRDLARELPPRR